MMHAVPRNDGQTDSTLARLAWKVERFCEQEAVELRAAWCRPASPPSILDDSAAEESGDDGGDDCGEASDGGETGGDGSGTGANEEGTVGSCCTHSGVVGSVHSEMDDADADGCEGSGYEGDFEGDGCAGDVRMGGCDDEATECAIAHGGRNVDTSGDGAAVESCCTHGGVVGSAHSEMDDVDADGCESSGYESDFEGGGCTGDVRLGGCDDKATECEIARGGRNVDTGDDGAAGTKGDGTVPGVGAAHAHVLKAQANATRAQGLWECIGDGAWLHVEDGSGCFPNPRDREAIAMASKADQLIVYLLRTCTWSGRTRATTMRRMRTNTMRGGGDICNDHHNAIGNGDT